MRVITALAFVVGIGLSGPVGSATIVAAGDNNPPPPISQCYTVTISPPFDMRPTVTVCKP